MPKKIISTSKWHAKHPLPGRNTQQPISWNGNWVINSLKVRREISLNFVWFGLQRSARTILVIHHLIKTKVWHNVRQSTLNIERFNVGSFTATLSSSEPRKRAQLVISLRALNGCFGGWFTVQASASSMCECAVGKLAAQVSLRSRVSSNADNLW